jgi:hypothetical protein
MELDHRHPILTKMRLWVDWPAKLNNRISLKLRIDAQVVSADGCNTIVQFKSHEFVTSARRHSETKGANGCRPSQGTSTSPPDRRAEGK